MNITVSRPLVEDELSAAINRAIADLAALRDSIVAPRVSTMDLQTASALNHCDYAERVIEITGDLKVSVAQMVAILGNQFLGDADRKHFRTDDVMSDLIADARDWCDEACAEEAA